MSFTLFIDELAKIDIIETTAWYNSKKAGLGNEYYEAYKRTLLHITKYPFIYPPGFRNTRKAQVGTRFPYFIIYKVDADLNQIIVIAILYGGRDPNLLESRAK